VAPDTSPRHPAELTHEARIARLERGLVLLRDHVDRTMAELLAELNRISDQHDEEARP
jgi:hypothetical protein